MISMTLNQLLVINISLYIVSDMNARYARVSPISPPISDMKKSHPIRSWYPIVRTLLNHESDFRRNSAYRLSGHNENSVNNDNLNMTGAVDSYISIPLALIAFNNGANLELFWDFCFCYLFRHTWVGVEGYIRPLRLG